MLLAIGHWRVVKVADDAHIGPRLADYRSRGTVCVRSDRRREQLAPPCLSLPQLAALGQTFAATTATSICRNTRCEFEMTD